MENSKNRYQVKRLTNENNSESSNKKIKCMYSNCENEALKYSNYCNEHNPTNHSLTRGFSQVD